MSTITIQEVKTANSLGTLQNGDMLLGERVSGTGGVVTITATGTGSLVLAASPTFTGTVTLPSTTSIGTVSNTEIGYLDGVTSAVQTQMDLKAPLASPTFTGTVVLPSTTSIGTVSATEIGYVDGVTSAIQTQMDLKAPLASPTFTGTVVLPSTTSIDTVSSTEISYLDGVTSAIQTQINAKAATTYVDSADTTLQTNIDAKAPLASPTFTGTVTLPSTTSIGNVSSTEIGYVDGVTSAIQTQLNTKAMVLISTGTASSSATIDFTGLSSTYAAYYIDFYDLIPQTDTANLTVRMGTGAGPSWDSSGIYNYEIVYDSSAASNGFVQAASGTSILILSSTGSSANETGNGHITFFNPSSTAGYKHLAFATAFTNSVPSTLFYNGSGHYLSATAVTGIRFLMSSGNIASGVFKLYGVLA